MLRHLSPLALLTAVAAITSPLPATEPADGTSPGPVLMGRVGGGAYRSGRVPAGGVHTYNFTFRAGELARVTVDGDGDTDLDVYVYDENWNLIDFDDDATDYCVAMWYPEWTGTFHVEIRNLGTISNRYVLTTN
jgi:hypothetical protein